jgi:hypothetical protein
MEVNSISNRSNRSNRSNNINNNNASNVTRTSLASSIVTHGSARPGAQSSKHSPWHSLRPDC